MVADQSIQLPALRSELRIRSSQNDRFPWLIEDPILLQRLPLDILGKSIVEHLRQSHTPQSLYGAVSADQEQMIPPTLLYRHVTTLQQYGLFEGVRANLLREAAKIAQSEPPASELPADLPLKFVDGLKHACQACGSCCSATDIGPISSEQAETIRSHEWSGVIDGLAPGEDVFRQATHEGSTILLTRMRNGQCVFLADDKRCLVHRHMGLAAKPTPCRQFPYVFSKVGDHVDVSLSMECRAYWKAKQAASPPSEHQESLRELIQLGAPIHEVPELVQVNMGLSVHRSKYVALEQDLIAALEKPSDDNSPLAPIRTFVREANDRLDEIMRPIRSDETGWINPATWSAIFGCAMDDEKEHAVTMKDLLDGLVEFCDEAVLIARKRGLEGLANRFSFLGASSRAASDPQGFERLRWLEPEVAYSIVSDLIIGGLFSKDLVRTAPIQFGLGMLSIRAVLTVYGACHRAREACRVEVTVQDLIDSMVTLSKMLRERAVLDFMRDHEKSLFSLFVRDFTRANDT